MLDKLVLTTPSTDLTKEKICQLLQGQYSRCTTTASKFHYTVLVFHLGIKDHLVSIHLHPRFPTISGLKFEINPSHFKNSTELKTMVQKFADPNALKITRIDHCVDLTGITVQEVYSKLIYSRKKAKEIYRDGKDLSTFYLGLPPERLLVYNKSKSTESGIKTRIEIQQYRDKIEHKDFRNLANFQSVNPFVNIQFKEIVDQKNTNERDKVKVAYLKDSIETRGAQGNFKALNSHSNFKRDFGHLLAPPTHFPDLGLIYKTNLKNYFEMVGTENNTNGEQIHE